MSAIETQLERRRAAAAEAWGLRDEVVLIGAGEPIHIPGRHDLTYPFRAHAEYFYLTDRERPAGVLAFDPLEGWFDFVAPVTEAERLWSGATDGSAGGRPLPDLEPWLQARAGRRVGWLGVPAAVPSGDAALAQELRFDLDAVRRPKDELELERMRAAERATRAAFAAVLPRLQEGVSEREAQIALETAALLSGADTMAYETIVGGGPNAAVLHFPPSPRRFREGELVLIDAGAECRGYACDVTRTYPVGEGLSGLQGELHALVRAAELAAIGRCRPGVEWRDVHLEAAQVIAEGLIGLGLLRGSRDSLIESGAVWLFFPHGVGHLLGLGVRDAGGALRERRDKAPPYPNLRIDLPLGAGFVVTVEPGVYFVPAILQDPERRRHHAGEVDWEQVERLLDFGGIRVEDNVLVLEDGHEVLTGDIPVLG